MYQNSILTRRRRRAAAAGVCAPGNHAMCPNPDPNPRPDPAQPDPAPGAPPKSGPGQGKGKRGECLVRHFKIDEMLSPDDRTAYEALLLDPKQTVDSLLAWLKARGYVDITRSSVQRHRRYFETDVKEIRKSAKVAGQFAALARAHGGAGGLADAGQFRFEQMFLERLFSMEKDDRMTGKEWSEFGKAMAALLDNRQKYETLRLEWQSRAERAATAVEKAAGKGRGGKYDGVALANHVRRLMGVPLPGEPLPALPPPGQASIGRAAAWTPEDEARSKEMIDAVTRELNPPPPAGPPKGQSQPLLPPPGAGEN